MFNRDEWILEQQNPMISIKKWQTTVDLIANLYESPIVHILQCTGRGYQVVVGSNTPTNPFRAGHHFPPDSRLFSARVISRGAPLYVNHAASMAEWRENPVVREHRINSFLAVPIYWPDGVSFGTICVLDFAVTHYSRTYQDLLLQFRDLVEGDLLLNNQFLQLLELSTRDELTRLFNRRGFFAEADKHVRLAQRLQQSVGIMYLDLDHLKQLNDDYGHRLGDKAIAALGTAIRNVMRDSDVAGRIGGDEFVVVLMTPDEQSLPKMAARVRAELKQLCQGELADLTLSVSIGYRLFPVTEISVIDRMVSLVDERMYEDKNNHQQQLDAR
ncbi:MAG: sensor domain-containing diguanylate cyclase [Pseudomonadota bacterium]|nr:hypothetical protein [Pseudomonadales bacterium]MDY6919274.1 sensor domain-containing diguanylate cyclase [Pseudomonadota bacterium]